MVCAVKGINIWQNDCSDIARVDTSCTRLVFENIAFNCQNLRLY